MSKRTKKVIVTAAVTGGIHTPSMTPHLPCGIEEISRAAIEAGDAGASIVLLIWIPWGKS